MTAKIDRSKSTALLNKVQRFLIDFANEQGILLANDFDSPDAFKEFVFAFTYKSLIDLGIPTAEAYDLVCGEGAFTDLYEQLREMGQASTAAV